MSLQYNHFETFMAANGVSFSAKEVVGDLLKKAESLNAPVTQEQIETELALVKSKSAADCDIYARETLGINTGNRFCS